MPAVSPASAPGMATLLKASLISAALALALPAAASAAPEIRTVSGASPAALAGDHQRLQGRRRRPALARSTGTACPRRATFPNRFPGGFFGNQRGAEFDTPGVGTEISNGSPWGGGFQRYSGDKLFAPVGSNYTNVRFNVPGTQRQAFTSAFGVVLSDVDTTGGASSRSWTRAARRSSTSPVPPGPNGLSFVGVRFRDGERVAEVQVRAGTAPIAPGVVDTPADRPRGDRRRALRRAAGRSRAAARHPVRRRSTCRRRRSPTTPARRTPRLRASLITLAKSVRRNRTLKVDASAARPTPRRALTLGKTVQHPHARGGRDPVLLQGPGERQARQAEARLELAPRRRRSRKSVSDHA